MSRLPIDTTASSESAARGVVPAARAGHAALVVGHPGGIGGMETFCRFLTRTMLSSGWQVTVCLSGENIYATLSAEFSGHIRIHRVDWIDRTCAGDREYAPARLWSRRQWFRAVQPDVALVVQSSNTPFRCAVLGARLAGVPVISTHRTMAWPVEHVPSRRHLFGLLPGLGLHGRRMVARTRLTALASKRIVYNSAAVRRGYEELYRYPLKRGVVIPNAVDASATPACTRQHTQSIAEGLAVGFVGRLGADKSLDVLLRAVASMHAQPPAQVRIYGEGAEQPRLMALAAELHMADRVQWCGVTQDARSAYAGLDVVVLCSARESSSNMILEAMAMGKAVVVTDTGGMPELVDYGKCGVCVPVMQVEPLAAALDRLANDAGRRTQLGEQARLRAVELHHPQAIARAWMALLTEVARRPGHARRGSAAGPRVESPVDLCCTG